MLHAPSLSSVPRIAPLALAALLAATLVATSAQSPRPPSGPSGIRALRPPPRFPPRPLFPLSLLPVADGPWMTESADIDGDGDQDLVAANDTVSVLRNGGGGRFETTAEFIVDLSAYDLVAVALTDLDGDADADLVALSNAAAGVYVLPNDGTGTFSSSTGYWSGGGDSGGFALGDLDGDGDRDIVCVSGTLAGGKGGFANVLVLLNDGDGTFQYGEQHGLFGKEPYRVAVVLYDVLGCSYAEIAATTGVPEGTVKSRIFRARAELAVSLGTAVGRTESND